MAKHGLLPDLSGRDRTDVERLAEDNDDTVALMGMAMGIVPPVNSADSMHGSQSGSDVNQGANAGLKPHSPPQHVATSPCRTNPSSATSVGSLEGGGSPTPTPLPPMPTTGTGTGCSTNSGTSPSSSSQKVKTDSNPTGTNSSDCSAAVSRGRSGSSFSSFSSDIDSWDSLLLYVPLLQPTKLDDSRRNHRESYSWAGSRRKGVLGASMDYLGFSSMGPMRMLGWVVVACSVYIMATEASSGDGDGLNSVDAMDNMTL